MNCLLLFASLGYLCIYQSLTRLSLEISAWVVFNTNIVWHVCWMNECRVVSRKSNYECIVKYYTLTTITLRILAAQTTITNAGQIEAAFANTERFLRNINRDFFYLIREFRWGQLPIIKKKNHNVLSILWQSIIIHESWLGEFEKNAFKLLKLSVKFGTAIILQHLMYILLMGVYLFSHDFDQKF